jgi:hypothetical protein
MPKDVKGTLSAFGAAVGVSGTLGLATLLPHAGIGILVYLARSNFWENSYFCQIAGLITLGTALASGVQKRAEQRKGAESSTIGWWRLKHYPVKMADLVALQHEREEVALKFSELREVLDQLHKLDMDFGQTIESLGAIQGISGMVNIQRTLLRERIF